MRDLLLSLKGLIFAAVAFVVVPFPLLIVVASGIGVRLFNNEINEPADRVFAVVFLAFLLSVIIFSIYCTILAVAVLPFVIGYNTVLLIRDSRQKAVS